MTRITQIYYFTKWIIYRVQGKQLAFIKDLFNLRTSLIENGKERRLGLNTFSKQHKISKFLQKSNSLLYQFTHLM